MKVEYHPDTVSDLTQAIAHYESQRAGLGDELRQEIYRTIDRIALSPERYRVVVEHVRRCFVKRFPFSILYRIVDEESVRILVIRHHRQHPAFGLRRQ